MIWIYHLQKIFIFQVGLFINLYLLLFDRKHHSMSKYSGIRWKMDSFLQYLDYADNICLLSPSVLDAANML